MTDSLRFDANLSLLFTELPLRERPAAAKAAGFDAVELWWPFVGDPTPSDADLDALVRALDEAGTQLVGLNFDAGDLSAGWRGLLSLPRQADRFRANVDVTVELAERTGCRTLNALYGNRVHGIPPGDQDALALDLLTVAARAADRIGATVVVEPLNAYDSPGFPVTSARQGLDVVERVRAHGGVDNVALLADLYHLHRMGEDPVDVLTTYAADIAHVQVADDPGRHQPGTGSVDFAAVFDTLVSTGYPGWVGCEYKPLGPSAESFSWMPAPARPVHA